MIASVTGLRCFIVCFGCSLELHQQAKWVLDLNLVLVLESPERLGWQSEECPQRMGQFIGHYRTQFTIQLDLLLGTLFSGHTVGFIIAKSTSWPVISVQYKCCRGMLNKMTEKQPVCVSLRPCGQPNHFACIKDVLSHKKTRMC